MGQRKSQFCRKMIHFSCTRKTDFGNLLFVSSRLLQMGVYNAELFTNLGLCCFFAQQYDMTLNCFERALALASDENMADVWYNIGHVAVVKIIIFSIHGFKEFYFIYLETWV